MELYCEQTGNSFVEDDWHNDTEVVDKGWLYSCITPSYKPHQTLLGKKSRLGTISNLSAVETVQRGEQDTDKGFRNT